MHKDSKSLDFGKSSQSGSLISANDVGYNFSLCSYPSRNLFLNCNEISIIYIYSDLSPKDKETIFGRKGKKNKDIIAIYHSC